MLKKITVLISLLFYILTGLLVFAAVGGAVTKKPFLLTVIKSGSMHPVFKRGYIVLIENLGEGGEVKLKDIVVFRSESGSLASKGWVMHRAIGGNSRDGFITKGDANDYTDQQDMSPAINRKWIAARAMCIGEVPLRVPLIGYLPLWLENMQKSPFVLPGIAVFLIVVLGISELFSNKKKQKSSLEQQTLFFFGGLTMTVVFVALTLASSQRFNFSYEVTLTEPGVSMSGLVGVVQLGQVKELKLSKVGRKGLLPMTIVASSKDYQISFNKNVLKPEVGSNEELIMKLTAQSIGKFKSTVWIGTFFPVLPAKLIYFLAKQSYWLALIITSLIPAVPLFLYPLLEPGLRRKTIKETRRKLRKLTRSV